MQLSFLISVHLIFSSRGSVNKALTKYFMWLVCRVVGLHEQTRHANDFVNAKSLAREKPSARSLIWSLYAQTNIYIYILKVLFVRNSQGLKYFHRISRRFWSLFFLRSSSSKRLKVRQIFKYSFLSIDNLMVEGWVCSGLRAVANSKSIYLAGFWKNIQLPATPRSSVLITEMKMKNMDEGKEGAVGCILFSFFPWSTIKFYGFWRFHDGSIWCYPVTLLNFLKGIQPARRFQYFSVSFSSLLNAFLQRRSDMFKPK